MKIVLQRVKSASVSVDGKIISSIGIGFLLLIGIGNDDSEQSLQAAAHKISKCRIFEDDAGNMNLDIESVQGEVIAVSQFTLYADTRKGNRPSFTDAAPPEIAEKKFNLFVEMLREKGLKVLKYFRELKVMLPVIEDGQARIPASFY